MSEEAGLEAREIWCPTCGKASPDGDDCLTCARWWRDNPPDVAEARAQAIEEATAAQPSTAENPNESAYQRGRFDGIMEYAAAIRALKTPAGEDGR